VPDPFLNHAEKHHALFPNGRQDRFLAASAKIRRPPLRMRDPRYDLFVKEDDHGFTQDRLYYRRVGGDILRCLRIDQ
jgi:hypothetical protein